MFFVCRVAQTFSGEFSQEASDSTVAISDRKREDQKGYVKSRIHFRNELETANGKWHLAYSPTNGSSSNSSATDGDELCSD